MTNKNDSQQYNNDLEQWQRNQYIPGAYTGGNFPPHIKYGGKKIGYVILIQGLFVLLFGILMIFEAEEINGAVVTTIFGLVISFVGWNKIRNSKK